MCIFLDRTLYFKLFNVKGCYAINNFNKIILGIQKHVLRDDRFLCKRNKYNITFRNSAKFFDKIERKQNKKNSMTNKPGG